MADKRISQLIERVDIENNDVLPIVASGATTTNKVTISTIQSYMQGSLDVGVTSVGLVMPSAFSVSGSPVTTSGNITVSAAGTASQYIRGDGTLADFPTGGGGGASISYYLNGSVSQGTIGGIAYQEVNKTPILGTGTDFNINANGYIASFITDAGDPGLLEIPGGNWNFETYFSASSGGGSPTFYVELYKVSGSTATLIASNSSSPELIAFGTTINAYFSSLAVPQTSLLVTDRLAIRYYVTHSGRTITLHTEDNHLCQIITTFTTGLTALNGLTAQVQNFAVGTSGTDFNISSSGSIHTFNIPTATSTIRGLLSASDWVTFNGKQPSGNYVTTDTTQTITGEKTFSGSSLRLAANGTADAVVLRNVSGTTGSDSGATTMGFNGSDNLFISTQSRGGFVLAFNNSVSNREYTLPDASGTIALTSNLSSYLPLSGGTLTGALNGTSASFSGNGLFGGSSAVSGLAGGISVNGSTNSGINFRIADTLRGYLYVAGNGSMNLESTSGNIILSPNGSPAFTISSTGAATFSSSVTAGGSGNTSNAFSGQNNSTAQATIYSYNHNAAGWSIYSAQGINYFAGNVGIGTSSPGDTLHIAKNGTGAYSAALWTNSNSTANLYVGVAGSGVANTPLQNNAYVMNAAASALVLGTSDSERMRITSGGAVLINQQSSDAASGGSFFQLTQNNANWIHFVRNSATSGSVFGCNIVFSYAPNNTSSAFFAGGDTGAERYRMYANGGLANYQSNDVNLSDERTKKDIEPLESYWDKFKDIEIVKFKYKDQTHDDFNIGVIAQQVESVAPEFVDVDGWNTKPELDEEGNEIVSEEEPLKSIYTADLYHASIKVLQEAMAKIEKLEAEVEALKSQING